LRAFRGVQTIEDYLDRVVAAFPPPKRRGAAVALPPMAIPDALGYLDVVWRLREGRALIGRAVPGPFARLALSCSAPEDCDSRRRSAHWGSRGCSEEIRRVGPSVSADRLGRHMGRRSSTSRRRS